MHFSTEILFKSLKCFFVDSSVHSLFIIFGIGTVLKLFLLFGCIFAVLRHQRLIEFDIFSEILERFFELLDFRIEDVVFALVLIGLVFDGLINLSHTFFELTKV